MGQFQKQAVGSEKGIIRGIAIRYVQQQLALGNRTGTSVLSHTTNAVKNVQLFGDRSNDGSWLLGFVINGPNPSLAAKHKITVRWAGDCASVSVQSQYVWRDVIDWNTAKNAAQAVEQNEGWDGRLWARIEGVLAFVSNHAKYDLTIRYKHRYSETIDVDGGL